MRGADLGLLRRRDLRLLVVARFVSVFGSSLTPIALAFAVLELPGAGIGGLGIVLTAQAIPQVLFLLMGGVIADRFPRARVIVLAELVGGAAALGAGSLLVLGTATIPWLAALAAVNGLAVALISPALTGIVPEVVEPVDLQPANALLRLATNIARIGGTAAAGILVTLMGAGWTVVLDGFTFLAGGLLMAFVHGRVRERADAFTPLHDLRDGWHEFISRRWIVVVVLVFSVMNMATSAALGVLGPAQAKALLGGAGPWAAIMTSFSLGTVVGVVVAVRIRPPRPILVAMLVAPLFAVPFALIAVPTQLWVIMVSAFIAGISVDVFGVLWETSLQRNVPEESLSRVSSYDWLGSSMLAPVGIAMAAPLALAIGLGPALWVCFGLVLGPVGLALLEPSVRNLRS
jgi:MFS family permease